MLNENARDKAVDVLLSAFPDLRAFADKPYSYVVPYTNDDGSVTYVKVGITTCSQRVDVSSTTLPAKEYVPLERQVRSFAKKLVP